MVLEIIHWSEARKPRESEIRRRLEDEGFRVLRWRDDAGAIYQAQAHDHDESLWVVHGEIVFGVGGLTYPLSPGDRLNLPSGTVHTAYTGADGCLYFIGQREVSP